MTDDRPTLDYQSKPAEPRMSVWAILSLGLAIVGPPLSVLSRFLPDSRIWPQDEVLRGFLILGAFGTAGVIARIAARRQIAQSSGRLRGRWPALLGFVINAFCCALAAFGVLTM